MSKRFTTDSANAALDAAGALPLEPYSGNMSKKWACQCKKCGKEIFPRMGNLATGKKACKYCYGMKPLDPVAAESALDAAGAIPLEPYSGNKQKEWACQCKKCDKEIFPRMVNIAKGSMACKYCYGKTPLDTDAAESKMIAAGVVPLEPFPGSHTPWKVRCLRCGHKSSPTYGNIAKGQGGCFRCGTNYGDYPAHVYLVHDLRRKVVKIGITNEHAHRMKKYGNWNIVEFFPVATGKEAAKIEAEVLLKWSTEMGLEPKLTRFELRSGGYTETVDESGLQAAIDILKRYKH